MKRLDYLIQTLDITRVSNGRYYNLRDLQECLNHYPGELIEVGDYILVPYYIYMGKVLELYEYELTIVADKTQSFEEYILEFTGRKSIDDIPVCIIERKKRCYIECIENSRMMKTENLREYIRFLLSDKELQSQVIRAWKPFDAGNLFVELY